MNQVLQIKDLHVAVVKKPIIKGLNLSLGKSQLHILMGPNGSGKSTLTYALMGHPSYEITQGEIWLNQVNLLPLKVYERARIGLLLAFQNPLSIPGITLSNLLRTAFIEIYGKEAMSIIEFHKLMQTKAKLLDLDPILLKRGINDGFSGGEKKKAEMLQILLLRPQVAIFDEIDTGLDVDALKIVSYGINLLQKEGVCILLITHYQRILNYLKPDRVHIIMNGVIKTEGGFALAKQIEKKGYTYV